MNNHDKDLEEQKQRLGKLHSQEEVDKLELRIRVLEEGLTKILEDVPNGLNEASCQSIALMYLNLK